MSFYFALVIVFAAASEQDNEIHLTEIGRDDSDVLLCVNELVELLARVEDVDHGDLLPTHHIAMASEGLYRQNLLVRIFLTVRLKEFKVLVVVIVRR